MSKAVDMTEGHIGEKLIKLALPIMGTSFIQMAYNLIDMMWVGRMGSSAVAAVGTAGFYPWLAMAFVIFSKVGCEVNVSQNMGRKDIKGVKSYIKAGLEINMVLSVLYSIMMIMFNSQLIGFFRLGDNEVSYMAKQYLVIVAIGMMSYFINPLFTSIFNGMGNSRQPFIVNTAGLVVNIILDPILIFGIGPIRSFGVAGAAIATVCSNIVVTLGFLILVFKNKEFFKVKLFRNFQFEYHKVICTLGAPVALKNALFTVFSMIMGVIVAAFGPVAIAAQKVGSQIESISWMSSEGLAAALSTFVGQNYGARKPDRIDSGCRIAIFIAVIWGIFTTIVLVFFCRPIFAIFISEPQAIEKGADYLRILGYSQLFMCIEITVEGIFQGIGRTYIPSIVSIVLTGARIPMAYILSKPDMLGLNGIWWSVSISSVFKGIIVLTIFIFLSKLNKLYKEVIEKTAA